MWIFIFFKQLNFKSEFLVLERGKVLGPLFSTERMVTLHKTLVAERSPGNSL